MMNVKINRDYSYFRNSYRTLKDLIEKFEKERGKEVNNILNRLQNLKDFLYDINDEDSKEDYNVIIYDTCKYHPNGKPHYTIT